MGNHFGHHPSAPEQGGGWGRGIGVWSVGVSPAHGATMLLFLSTSKSSSRILGLSSPLTMLLISMMPARYRVDPGRHQMTDAKNRGR